MQYCRKCPDAVAQIQGGMEAPRLSGCVEFYQENGCVLIVARVSGLPRVSETGFFGFHIHQGKSCSGTDFETGSHYNPHNETHCRGLKRKTLE
jgi:Cu-Zn family superoxide dismutase